MKLTCKFFGKAQAGKVPRIEINAVKSRAMANEEEMDENYEALFRQAREAQKLLDHVLGELAREPETASFRMEHTSSYELSEAEAYLGSETSDDESRGSICMSRPSSRASTSCSEHSSPPSPAHFMDTTSHSFDESADMLSSVHKEAESPTTGKKLYSPRRVANCIKGKISPKLFRDKRSASPPKDTDKSSSQSFLAQKVNQILVHTDLHVASGSSR